MTDKPTVGFVGVGNMGLLAEDLSIAMRISRETGTAAPLSALVREMIVSAETMFGPGSDHTEMAKWCERLVGDELTLQD